MYSKKDSMRLVELYLLLFHILRGWMMPIVNL